MSKAKMGARVLYCGHDATFVADVWRIGNVNVVIANGSLLGHNNELLVRPAKGATHHLEDYPEPGYWNPSKGIFVVPEKQCKQLPYRRARDDCGQCGELILFDWSQ